MNRKKTRMISFRVTEQEFKELQALCDRQGIRNISALTRSALTRVGEEPGAVDHRLRTVGRRIEALEEAVRELSGQSEAAAG